jgi:putative oxidoreductase
MSNSSNSAVPLVGRILVSVMFLVSAFFKLTAYSQTVGYAAAKGLPLAGVAVAIAAALELLGGIAILAGFQTRIVASVLFLYLIPTSFYFHNFWAMTGLEQQDNMVHFLKNLAIMGGLLILAANGPGAYAVDARSSAQA